MKWGVYSGTRRSTEARFSKPKLIVVGTGSLTQPIETGKEARNLCEWKFLDDNSILAEYHHAFSYYLPIGTGSAFLLELPYPAYRPPQAGDGIVPMGFGYEIKALADPQPQVKCFVSLADKRWFPNIGSDIDKYLQIYFPETLSWDTGAATWDTSSNTKTITHNLGSAPVPSDITFNLSSGSALLNNDIMPIQIDSCNSTTFTAKFSNFTVATTTPSLQQARADGTSATGTVSATLGSSPTSGNILVAVVGSNAATTSVSMTTPGTGWTTITQANATASNSINIFARVVAGGEGSTYTATCTGGSNNFIQVYEIKDADITVAGAIPAANYRSQANASGTSAATPSLTPTSQYGAYAIAGIWWSGGATSAQSIDSSFSIHAASTNRGASADRAITSTSGSYQPTFSWTTARSSASALCFVQGKTISLGYRWKASMLHNSNKGEGGALFAPYTPYQQTILKGLFLKIVYRPAL